MIRFIRSVNAPKSPGVFIVSALGGRFAGSSHFGIVGLLMSFMIRFVQHLIEPFGGINRLTY
jgi:hypothetical protein